EEAVLAVEALFVGGVAPRLGVTGAQVFGTIDAGDAAAGFELLDAGAEQALSAASDDQLGLVGIRERRVRGNLVADVLLPHLELGIRSLDRRLCDLLGARQSANLGGDQIGELERE